MRYVIVGAVVLAGMAGIAAQQPAEEAVSGFDSKSNGALDQSTYQADKAVFDEVEVPEDGLGPLYNAQSCRECHQDPISGGASQVTELRVGQNRVGYVDIGHRTPQNQPAALSPQHTQIK